MRANGKRCERFFRRRRTVRSPAIAGRAGSTWKDPSVKLRLTEMRPSQLSLLVRSWGLWMAAACAAAMGAAFACSSPADVHESDEVKGKACFSCHSGAYSAARNPVHVNQLPQTCQDCHQTKAWVPSTATDHPYWPILNKHVGVSCVACHSKGFNVGDTPNQGGANYGTPDFPHLSCGNGPDGDMFMNYMDYVDDEAMQMFSRGQIERMDAALAGPRASLASSAGLEPPAAPSTPSAAARDAGIFTLVPPQRRFNGIDWR